MRTYFYGDTIRYNADHKRTSYMTEREVYEEREPRGNDMAVFDRGRGGRDSYERPMTHEDSVWIRRGRH